MDNSTTLIGLAMALACTAPIIFFEVNKRSKQKALVNKLTEQVSAKNLIAHIYDIWQGHAIAIDEKNKMLYFSNGSVEMTIDLTQLKKVRVIKVFVDHNNKSGNYKYLEHIKIGITKGGKSQELMLDFYDRAEAAALSNELQLAEKWCALMTGYTQKH